MDLTDLCGTLRLSPGSLRAAFRVGSRVYGSARPGSDEDFLLVLSRPDARQDLLWGEGCNAIIHGLESFQEALDEHSMMAIEAWFAPPPHRLLEPRPPFRFALRRDRLIAAASERARSDLEKARKRFDDEPGPSRKKVFHAVRVAMFARELLDRGKLTGFDQATPLLTELESLDDWPAIERRFEPLLRGLLAGLAPAKRQRA